MTATNHAISGAIIGAILPLPIAIPVAFMSHFILDSLPHFGISHEKRQHSNAYKLFVVLDSVIALSYAASGIVFHKWNMEICGWAAYAPDSTWVLHYFWQGKNLNIETKNWFMRMHRRIQKFEKPWGIIVDLSATVLMTPIFIKLITK